MTKFIVVYYSPASAAEKMAKSTPEEMKTGMQAWMHWAGKCGNALSDMGAPLGNGQTLTGAGVKTSTKKVSGYSILEAKDMKAALKMLEGHPHLGWVKGSEIGVHEAMPMPGQ